MKNTVSFFCIVFIAIQYNARAERINIPGLDIPKLIISEVRPDALASAYVEISNMGDTAIDLEPFTLHSVHHNTRCIEYSDNAISFMRSSITMDPFIGKIYLSGVIQPGESFVVANVWDTDNARNTGIPVHNTAIAQIGKQFAHINEETNKKGWINKPEWQCFGYDSVSAQFNMRLHAEKTAGYLLHWVFTNPNDPGQKDSTYIDQFNHFWNPNENEAAGISRSMKGFTMYPIAGVANAMTNYTMVRKANITQGNLNWENSRGRSPEDSEWIVVPKSTSNNLAFTTAGVHGVYDLNYNVKEKHKTTVLVNDASKTISVPWEMVRGDSLSRYFNLGDGMSWFYGQVGEFEDSAYYTAHTGDTFTFYALGNEMKKADYTLQVRKAESDLARVFPKRRLSDKEKVVLDAETGFTDTILIPHWADFVYAFTQGTVIDTIMNIKFATRIDTLLKYLDKPEQASWEIVFVDGKERVDLKFGDQLKIISEDRTATKEYFLRVNDYVPDESAVLKTVTWPDIDTIYYPLWNKGDTLPQFSSNTTEYTINLHPSATQIPAFQFIPKDIRSTIKVTNALDINGSKDQRTTSVVVTSESRKKSLTYNFEFQKQDIPVQPYIAHPFISEMIWNVATQGCAVELYNPGTEYLDLSKYMFVAGKTNQTWQKAVETCVPDAEYSSREGLKIYQTHYVPSKRWIADGSAGLWSQLGSKENGFMGKGFLKDDKQTSPLVKGHDVWVMSVATSATNNAQIKIRNESDFIFRGTEADGTLNAWDNTTLLHRETPIWNDPRHNMWLLKVLNDSILNGTKDVRDARQYELIDRIEVTGDTIAGRVCKGKNWSLIRKPNISKGSLKQMGGASSTPMNSEWVLRKGTDDGVGNDNMVVNLGVHTVNPQTSHLSTITSLWFIVTPGFEGSDLSITGRISDYTPTTIANFLDKANNGQAFTFMREGIEISADENLADKDVLVVTSSDEKNTTNYTLVHTPLDNNTSLIAMDGSGLTIENNKVTGVTLGMPLKSVLDEVVVTEKSVLNVLSVSGTLLPQRVHTKASLRHEVIISDGQALQVVAENNDVKEYKFDFGFTDNDAVLFSDLLTIDQDKKLVVDLPKNSTATSMLSMVYTNKGAKVKILDKAGFERTVGFIKIDDVVQVSAADGITKVHYRFNNVTHGPDAIIEIKGSNSAEGEFHLFPNPTNGNLTIDTKATLAKVNVGVYTISGKMVCNYKFENTQLLKLNLQDLPPGIYTIKLTAESKNEAYRIIIE